LVFFSLSGSKLPGYVLPSVPPAVILGRIFIGKLLRNQSWRGRAVAAGAATTFLVYAALLIFALPRYAEFDSVRSLISSADERGYSSYRVANMQTISHNAEFYAAGRLLRDEGGKLQRLENNADVIAELAKSGEPLLLLVPLKSAANLIADKRFETEVIGDNGELEIVLVKVRS
jgi:hypothetical protein